MGAEPGDPKLTPEQFDKYVQAERVQWAEVVKASGAKAN